MQHHYLIYLGLCLFFLFPSTIKAQDKDNRKSINNLLAEARKLERKAPQKALALIQSAFEQSKTEQMKDLEAESLRVWGLIHKKNGNFDSADIYYQRSLVIYQSLNDLRFVALVYNNLGNLYKNKGEYGKALVFHEKSLKIRQSLSDSVALSKSLNNIALVYLRVGFMEKANEHLVKSIKIKERHLKPNKLITGYNNLGLVNATLHRYDKALYYYNEVNQILAKHPNTAGSIRNFHNLAQVEIGLSHYKRALSLCNKALDSLKAFQEGLQHMGIYNTIGAIYVKQGQHVMAKNYFMKSAKLAHEKGLSIEEARAMNNLGDLYIKSKQFTQAENLYQSILPTVKSKDRNLEKTIYQNRSIAQAGLGNYDLFEKYYQQYVSLKDSLFNEQVVLKTSLLQEIYETEKKDQLLREQQQANYIQQIKLYAISITGFLALSTTLIVIRYQYLKGKTAKQLYDKNIDELISTHELDKLKAMIDGEEHAKKEIAADLHDNVKNLLKVIQINFEALGGKVEEIQTQQRGQYEQVNSLLNKTSDEIQHISTRLKSGTLSKFGLQPALEELIELFASDRMDIDIQVYLQYRLPSSTEFELYRIAQELIGNALKHAEASEFNLQLHQDEDGLSLTVEDNGKGFDVETAKKKGRMGLQNIEARTHTLGGEISIDSVTGEGTTIIINIPTVSTQKMILDY